MKTDRFSDSIRRKLESIRPEFADKDWTRMQASLQQAMPPQPGSPVAGHPFSGGIWSGSSWLLAAASVSTVALIAFSIWQRTEINYLRETVGQLRHQPAVAQSAPALPAQAGPALTRVDSQHRERSETGAPANTGQPVTGNQDTATSTHSDALPGASQQEATAHRSARQLIIELPKQRDVAARQTPALADAVHPQNKLNNNPTAADYGVSSTPLTDNQNVSTPSVVANKPVQSATDRPEPYAQTRKQPAEPSLANTPDNRPTTNRTAYAQNRSKANQPYRPAGQVASPNQRESATTVQPADQVGSPSASLADSRVASETFKLAISLPLSLPDRDWNTALVRRAKRMRPVQPLVAVPDALPASVAKVKAPESQPVAPLAAGFRAGLGTELAAHTWSAGVFSEIQLSKHWALGVGLSKATYLGGLFITAFDFDNRTHRDFQKEIGRDLNPKLDPKGDILNIDTRVQRFQLPLSLSYRLPLGRTLTLLPTVGTYLDLSSTEKATFYFRDSPRGFDQAYSSESHPVKLLNTFALSTAIEWQSRHWVVQGSPLLTVPLTPDPDWQKGSILGFRTRVMYQF